MNNLTWFAIKCPIMLNTANSKQIIIWFFICSCWIVQQTCQMGQKWTKMFQNTHYLTLFNRIWHYSTFKKAFIFNGKWKNWPVRTDSGTEYENEYRTFLNNFSQSNNLPTLSFYPSKQRLKVYMKKLCPPPPA